MNLKHKPLTAFRSAYARGIVTRFIAFAITLFAAVVFFQERHQLESRVWELQDRLAHAELESSNAASSLQDAESNILSLEESLRDAQSQLAGDVAYFELPVGYIEAEGFSGAELTLLSCVRIKVAHQDATDFLDQGVALVKFEVWDRKAVREMLGSGDYEMVGKASSTSDWDDSGDLHYYMLKEVRDRRDFTWSEQEIWNDAFWDWQNHLHRECRRQN